MALWLWCTEGSSPGRWRGREEEEMEGVYIGREVMRERKRGGREVMREGGRVLNSNSSLSHLWWIEV